MQKVVLYYTDKKQEDNICLKSMFEFNRYIFIGWNDECINKNLKIIENDIKNGCNVLVFSGIELGWGNMFKKLKELYKKVCINVICNTMDSLLYYEYERNNFFDLLSLNKEKIVNKIGFLRKGQYEFYKSLGYKCSYLLENYNRVDTLQNIKKEKNASKCNINIGCFPLNYTWDKNIFNQLSVGKFLSDCTIIYNNLDKRMFEFLDKMLVNRDKVSIDLNDSQSLIKSILVCDVIISTSFTEYFHPLFFVSMEYGVPCLVGNTIDFFEQDSILFKYLVSNAEDNAIENSKKIQNIIEHKDEIFVEYKKWKKLYNVLSEKSIKEFLKF